MSDVIKVPSFGPKCPNHGCPLVDLPFPLPAKGSAPCEVSGAMFDFEVEVDQTKVVKDKDGNITKAVGWRLSGSD